MNDSNVSQPAPVPTRTLLAFVALLGVAALAIAAVSVARAPGTTERPLGVPDSTALGEASRAPSTALPATSSSTPAVRRAPGASGPPSPVARAAAAQALEDNPRARRAFERQARWEIEHVQGALDRFAQVAEAHDFEVSERLAVAQLLEQERATAQQLLSLHGERDLALAHASVVDLSEDTDNAVASVLSGDALRAYRLMRAEQPR